MAEKKPKPRVTVITADRPDTRHVRLGKRRFPVGEPIEDLSDTALKQLQSIRGLSVKTTGGDDADNPPQEA